MKKIVRKMSVLAIALVFCASFGNPQPVFADEAEESAQTATSISISPVNKILLEIEPNSVYDDTFKITNSGNSEMEFEVYASPYSFTYSENSDRYELGFNTETNYTQITRWITFRDASGNYVERPKFTAEPNGSVEVAYRISTPASIPNGGQYAVIFAHTLSSTVTSGGIKTEASPGLVVYGRAAGETISKSAISNLEISQTLVRDNNVKNIINASAKVKNEGNVDFMAGGKLVVTGVFGNTYYETPSNIGRISIIPETELVLSDTWEETPYFGIFNVSWTVTAPGSDPETISRTIVLLPAPIAISIILALTIITIWIIIMVRKRKERKSKFKF